MRRRRWTRWSDQVPDAIDHEAKLRREIAEAKPPLPPPPGLKKPGRFLLTTGMTHLPQDPQCRLDRPNHVEQKKRKARITLPPIGGRP